ncbi:adenosylcobinamide amidohydrolase [Denitromonas iodatirespirans]|uniref:Adenosylcobinamide amidohydrolase n=1 Tax=Denitromonas iodatirespirans TaxID=2795389 RepID=A0A944DFJ2_DENI1|nr:adenosylcobinamide amidohydrolase [Denitromonas iodatirespirans]MBT0964161.1 adenosylcobinamide amidohydrolase [Denitromonas iodatirespirans]
MLAPLPGITLQASAEAVHVHSEAPMTVLSSSFFGGGFSRVRHILNAKVAPDYQSDDPAADLQAIAHRCGVTEPFVGLLTAVPLRKARLALAERGALRVGVLATAGLSNATSAGLSPPCEARPGTINLIVLVNARLTRPALVNAIITVTEAKCAVLADLGARSPDGAPATGTSTDTVTVAATGRGPALPFAGPATVPGWLIAQAVRQAVYESLQAD